MAIKPEHLETFLYEKGQRRRESWKAGLQCGLAICAFMISLDNALDEHRMTPMRYLTFTLAPLVVAKDLFDERRRRRRDDLLCIIGRVAAEVATKEQS